MTMQEIRNEYSNINELIADYNLEQSFSETEIAQFNNIFNKFWRYGAAQEYKYEDINIYHVSKSIRIDLFGRQNELLKQYGYNVFYVLNDRILGISYNPAQYRGYKGRLTLSIEGIINERGTEEYY